MYRPNLHRSLHQLLGFAFAGVILLAPAMTGAQQAPVDQAPAQDEQQQPQPPQQQAPQQQPPQQQEPPDPAAQEPAPAEDEAPAAPPARPLVLREIPFVSDDERFLLRHPNNFIRMKVEEETVELMLLKREPDPGGTRAQLMVITPPVQGASLEQATQEYLDGVREAMDNVQVQETTQAQLGGEPAQAFGFQGQPQEGVVTQTAAVLTIKDGQVYVVAAVGEPQTFAGLKQTFDRLVESFQWNEAVADAGQDAAAPEAQAPDADAAMPAAGSEPQPPQPDAAAQPGAGPQPGTGAQPQPAPDAPAPPDAQPDTGAQPGVGADGTPPADPGAAAGIRFTPPQNWSAIPARAPGTVAAFQAPGEAADAPAAGQIQITVQTPAQPADEQALQQLVQQMSKRIEQTAGESAKLQASAIQLGGQPAQRLTYQREANGVTMQFLQILAVNDGKLYQIAYAAPAETFARHLPAAQAVIDSVKWE